MRIVAGSWRGRRIEAPRGRDTRPTTDRVREAWMSALQAELPGARVVDLFAGSGALGLEALSRGAAHATFVEDAPPALRIIRSNVEALGAADRADLVRGDALRYVHGLAAGAFDIAFADPPYGRDLAAALVTRWLETPFAAILSLEHRRDEVLPEAAGARQRRYGDTIVSILSAAS